MSDQTDRDEFEARAMRRRPNLTKPSPLLRVVREHFLEAGGDPHAFDFAVNHYARSFLPNDSAKLSTLRDRVHELLLHVDPEFGLEPLDVDWVRTYLRTALKDAE